MKIAATMVIVFIASLLSSAARAETPEAPLETSLCKLYSDIHDKHDKSYDNRVVRFQAQCTVTEHGAFYSDDNCPSTIFKFDTVARKTGSIGDLGGLLDWVYTSRFDVPMVRPACVCVARVKIENEAPKLNIVDVEDIWAPRSPRTSRSK